MRQTVRRSYLKRRVQNIQMFLRILLTILVVPAISINIEYAGLTFHALQRLLNFFQRDSSNINVDGLFCLRIAQGQLIALERSIDSFSDHAPTRLTDHHHLLESLSQQIDRIANESWNEIARRTPSYFQKFQLLLSRPFTIESQSKTIDFNLIEKNPEKDSYFDTEQSDACFTELIRKTSTDCLISETCLTKMTSTSTSDYRLTHQLLWILIAKNMNCTNIRSLIPTENYFCANIYADATSNLINKTNEDLFLEQLLLCAIDGFNQFLRLDWLVTVLKWQHPFYDCFYEDTKIFSRVRRNLLSEQTMSDGCLSHKSGLAAGLLATYTRYLLSPTDNDKLK